MRKQISKNKNKNKFNAIELKKLFGTENIQFIHDEIPEKQQSKTRDRFADHVQYLWEELKITFYRTAAIDRFSPLYVKASKKLEKIITELGSCIITIAVIEQNGQPMPDFAELKIHELICDVSYNFRKTSAALDEISFEMTDAFLALSDRLLSWAKILQRLEATQYNIDLIRAGKLDVNQLMEKDERRVRKNIRRNKI